MVTHTNSRSRSIRRPMLMLSIGATFALGACGGSGLALDDPWQVFDKGNGAADLAAPPSTDLVDYLPSAEAEKSLNSTDRLLRTRPTTLVDATITAAEPAFGFRHVDAATSGDPIPYDDLEEGDFRVIRLDLEVNSVVAGSGLEAGSSSCALMMLRDARAAIDDVKALVSNRDGVTWFPLGPLDVHAGAYAGSGKSSIVADYQKQGCLVLIDHSVMRPAADGSSIARLGTWQVTIDRAGGQLFKGTATSPDDLAKRAEDLAT